MAERTCWSIACPKLMAELTQIHLNLSSGKMPIIPRCNSETLPSDKIDELILFFKSGQKVSCKCLDLDFLEGYLAY